MINKEVEALAGQPICSTVDCRELPEIENSPGKRSWDFATFTTVQLDFDSVVNDLVQKITNIDCPIFVYCVNGANRSASVLAAALAQLTKKPLNQVLSEMKQARAYVSPSDPYYLMALQQSPTDTSEFKQQTFDELDYSWKHDWPDSSIDRFPTEACTSPLRASWLRRVTAKVSEGANPAKALPIKVTPEIDAFAEKCVSTLLNEVTEYLPQGDAFYEDHLEFDGRQVPIKVTLKPPVEGYGLADAETPTWWDMRKTDPGWTLSACYITLYETIPPRHGWQELKKAIIHELIHSVDTKLNDPNLFDTDWHRKHRQDMKVPGYVDSPAHYTAPWEQDAFMSSEAHSRVSMWKRTGVSKERAMEVLRYYMDENADKPVEQEWKKSPDLWRRYMKTMARTVQEIYGT